jgi:NTP pyrophosphohydrolases including oxidative damage repair enzymes
MTYISSPILRTYVKRQVMSFRCKEYWSVDLTPKVIIANNTYGRTVPKELILSKENRENCIIKLKRVKPIWLYGSEPVRRAAVLVPLCTVNNELSFLYTLRSSDLKSYRGQVSFPGGVQDKTEENLEETALRETFEELGIQRTQIDVWGNGCFVGTRQKDMAVMPFIGYLGEVCLERLILNRKEVESVFTVPLQHLIEPDNCKSTQFRNGYVLPVFVRGEHRIWGMTAIITHFVLDALLPTGTYVHKLHYIKSFKTTSPGAKKKKL